jgi:protein-S-isoprenylcysteine O-methyltransferase Ste14
MKALELKLPPPLVAGLAALIMWVVARQGPLLELAFPMRLSLAVLMVIAGLAVALAGVVSFHRAETTVNPFTPEKSLALVSSGIYRISRNPMYLGMLLGLLGWMLWLAAPWALVGPVLFVAWITRVQIVPEERALRARFGPEFEAYCRRVRRWL